jgi:hypothetical protein
MKARRGLTRRSFFVTVAGRAIGGGGALALLGGRAGAFQVTDSDGGASADPVGHGRGGGTGVTDSDPTDPGGRGRGPNAPRTGTGITDGDPSDPVGGGRGNTPGHNANARAYTGVTDSDSYPNADPAGSGRGSGPQLNEDQQRCAANRARMEAIQRQLSQHPYWSDQQIQSAAGDRDWLGSIASPDRSGDPEDYSMPDREARLRRSDTYQQVLTVCRRYGLPCGGGSLEAQAAAAQGQLQGLIQQALDSRGGRQALERELYSLQQRVSGRC